MFLLRKSNFCPLAALLCNRATLFDAREQTLDCLSSRFHVFCLSCHFLLTQTAEKTLATTPKDTASATQTSSSPTEFTDGTFLQSPAGADYGPRTMRQKSRLTLILSHSWIMGRNEMKVGGWVVHLPFARGFTRALLWLTFSQLRPSLARDADRPLEPPWVTAYLIHSSLFGSQRALPCERVSWKPAGGSRSPPATQSSRKTASVCQIGQIYRDTVEGRCWMSRWPVFPPEVWFECSWKYAPGVRVWENGVKNPSFDWFISCAFITCL